MHVIIHLEGRHTPDGDQISLYTLQDGKNTEILMEINGLQTIEEMQARRQRAKQILLDVANRL